jgi:hypothetical protein
MDNNTIISVLISILTISSTLFVVILQRKTEKLKIVENQLSQNKYRAYIDLVQVFYETLKDVKQKKESDSNILGSKIMDAKKDIFMFESDEVFQKFNSWLCYTSENPGDQKHLKYFLELMLEIRKDMRNNKTSLSKDDIMINLMQNKLDINKIRHLWND